MSLNDSFILMGVGGLFIVLGLATVIWGKREENSYFNAMAARRDDLREFVDHWPPRPQAGALKVGGWIAVVLGVIVLLVGVGTWLW